MLQDVRAVFFSSNRFIVSVDFRQPGWSFSGSSTDRSDFLRRFVPTNALSHLRSLEIIFPGTHHHFGSIDRHDYRLWTDSLGSLAPRLKKLSLRLYMTHNTEDNLYVTEYITPMTSLEDLFKVQEQIVRPLAAIATIESCFVRLMRPWTVQGVIQLTNMEQQLRKQETRLEKLVMGEEYDSVAAGRLEQRQSEWTKRYGYAQ